MQILETLILTRSNTLFQKLTHPLPLKEVPKNVFPSFRMEVDADTVLLIYALETLNESHREFVRHLFPHLKRILFLVDNSSLLEWEEAKQVLSLMEEEEIVVPRFVLAALHEEEYAPIQKKILEKGLYLEENARLLFWNPEEKESVLRVWLSVWGNPLVEKG